MNNKYTIIKQESIEELNGTGYILKHDKTGARVVVISNEDDNKVFQIGFRTPPQDDTGVPHILEHSVLCGSREFPMKDPFVELVKGSLNTFLNAMTYPDKTVYPVASQNDKDFFNLVHVYLDAVFYPNIYKKPEILKQEGWHYDLLSEDAPLTYNGVVFNEMKGVFSSPDQQLARIIQKSLLEDTPYGFESGGDPKAIPDLTYEMFLDFHKTYYHPSNSYIYLYGDMDVDEYLTFIDEHYLKDFDKKQIDSSWEKQEPFTEVKRVEEYYPVGENDSEEELEMEFRTLSEISNSIPLHLSRYHPAYKYTKSPTHTDKLERLYELGRKYLKYVYLGNVWDSKYESTYCPNCHTTVIIREGFKTEIVNLDKEGRCKVCNNQILERL